MGGPQNPRMVEVGRLLKAPLLAMGRDISRWPSCSSVATSASRDVTLAQPAACSRSDRLWSCGLEGARGMWLRGTRVVLTAGSSSRLPPAAGAAAPQVPPPGLGGRGARAEGPHCGAGLAPEQREMGRGLQSPFPKAAVLQDVVTASPPPPFPVCCARCLLSRIWVLACSPYPLQVHKLLPLVGVPGPEPRVRGCAGIASMALQGLPGLPWPELGVQPDLAPPLLG